MRVWFITGVSRGFGRALAEAALSRGDTVVGTVRDGRPEIDEGAGRLHLLPLDLTEADAAGAAVARAFELCGRIDVLVNNAGYGLLGAVEDATDAEIARLFEVNVLGPMRIIRAALPRLREQGSGHVINVTSVAGRAPMAGSGAYAAAKAAMEALSDSLAQEVAPYGIDVTAVAPGAFRTDFLSAHSIRKSANASGAYQDSAGAVTAYLDQAAGRQAGDPARGADAILRAVDAPEPPLHLLLGTDALRRARERIHAIIEEMDAWEEVTRSTDYPEGGVTSGGSSAQEGRRA